MKAWLGRAAVGMVMAFGLLGTQAIPSAADSVYSNNYACTPVYSSNTYYYNEQRDLYEATLACRTNPHGRYIQTSGYTWVTYFTPNGHNYVWFYVQQNPDQYTQLQISGPDSGQGWSWWAYYQQNPNCWYSSQVNTYSGGPYWHQTGYVGPVCPEY